MAFDKYRHYFDIDPDYFPTVNEAVIKKNPDMWKKYYPHDTFVKLLKDTVSVLRREQKRSIWVEGAYGTGKSHAVLTLKKLLDASEEETKEYFQKYQLSNDLYNKFQGAKNSGTILTVHRYGSSNIHSDANLVFAIQESIEKAMKEKGIRNKGESALKGSILKWLEDKENHDFFNSIIVNKKSDLFGGDNVDDVIEKLNTLSGNALNTLMDKIFKVADERQIKAMLLDTSGLVAWIKNIIKANDLKAIVFVWDEFTEYFSNNTKNLTGFQEIAEISATDPFYLMIVTHKSAGLFDDADKDKTKILDRFVKPTCIIELPENMAFQLIGVAMKKNKDEEVLKDWEITVDDLYDITYESRKLVKESADISDEEFKNILPIHPYTALLLKNISSAFDSNQRSMFDFIKDDRGDEIKGFQWFIDNYGPEDDDPLLTVDMLWDFFYKKGKEYLSHDIRSILDCYGRAKSQKLRVEQKKVLKAILLLQAISQKVGDSVELFIPNEKNVNNAFEGSSFDNGQASRCAESLVREGILYKKPLGDVNEILSTEKLKEMVDGVIKQHITPSTRYKDNYIVEMNDKEKAFNKATSIAFDISEKYCTSVEQTRGYIRNQMKKYSFPIWTLKYIIGQEETKTDKKILMKIIDYYCGIANNQNIGNGSESDNDIAQKIGELCITHKDASNDLKNLLCKEKCTAGMKAYLLQYSNGDLVRLAKEVDDGGRYINELRDKFDADAANWVWNVSTAQSKIDEVILDYKIILESNKFIPKTTSIEETVRAWCDKCNYIRISYFAVKDYIVDLSEFLRILYEMKKTNTLLDSQKEDFYNQLVINLNLFKELYHEQISYFKEICEIYVDDLTDEDIQNVYNTIPAGVFIRDKIEYYNIVDGKVTEYKKNSKSAELKKLWKDRTKTESPRDWSNKYKMPILCMVDMNEIQKARAAFNTINKLHPDEKAINDALDYLSNATFFDKLDDISSRNKAFIESIIKNFDIMLTDIDEVKEYLVNKISSEPYDWFGSPEVDRKLEQLAQIKYNQSGCEKALEKIDNMDLSDVKRYLKELIKDDMVVGMAIIKDN